MKIRNVFVLIVVLFLLVSGKAESNPKSTGVLEVLEEMGCEDSYTYLRAAFRLREVIETMSVDYSIVRESNLKLIESNMIQIRDGEKVFDTIFELYQDEGGEYLALARVGERVFCAQYINDYDSQSCYDEAAFPEDVYVYERISHSSLFASNGKVAYFLDGGYVYFQYGLDVQTIPSVCIRDPRANLVYFLGRDEIDNNIYQEKRYNEGGYDNIEIPFS